MAAPLMQMARRTRWPGYTRDPNDGRRRPAGPGAARAAAAWRGAARPALPLPASPGVSRRPPAGSLALPLHDSGLHEDLAGRAGADRVGDQLGSELVGRDDPQPRRRDPVADA